MARTKSHPYRLEPRGKRGILWVRFTAPGGREVFRSTGTTDRKLATEWASKTHAEIYRVTRLGEKPRRTWKEAVIRWRAEKSGKRSIGKDLRNLIWLDPYLGNKHLDEIDSDLLAEIVAKRMSEPKYKHPKAKDKETLTSRVTAEKMLALVRSILISARDWGWIDRLPSIKLYENGKPKEDYRWLTYDEARRLHEQLAPHLKAPFLFALATGWRDQNVFRLEWSRVDLTRKVAWVTGSMAKGKKAIGAPLNDQALRVLQMQVGKHPRWVFPNLEPDRNLPKQIREAKAAPTAEDIEPYLRGNNRGFKAAQRRAKIAPLTWHDLRHTWASWHVMAGTSLRSLMELGGWKSLQSVMRYAHLAPDHLAQEAHRVASVDIRAISVQPKKQRA